MRNPVETTRSRLVAGDWSASRLLLVATLALAGLFAGNAFGAEPSSETFDWDPWRRLPVLDRGRYKPLDTLAWETLRKTANQGSFTDPDSDKKISPTQLYLAMLFDWGGRVAPSSNRRAATMAVDPSAYFHRHEPDKWDKSPIIRLDSPALRDALGLRADPKFAEAPKHISPLDLDQIKFTDPESGKSMDFLAWAPNLQGGDEAPQIEKSGLKALNGLISYRSHRTGKEMNIIPVSDDDEQPWLSVADLVQTEFDDTTDASGALRKAQRQFGEVRDAFLDNMPEDFNKASAGFIATIKQIGSKRPFYPKQDKLDLEVVYNDAVPFRWAWILTLTAAVLMLLQMGTGMKAFGVAGWGAASGGLIASCLGFYLRATISAWAPVTNLYESVVYVGIGAMAIGMVLELLSRKKFVFVASATVATVTLILADNSPAVLDPEFGPLNPVLRSNFWLVTHVMSIMLGYAAFAVAMAIADITLAYHLVGSTNREMIGALSKFTLRAIQFGVLLLAAGTILGGVWADEAWGRFWGWDPKEVWALIALLTYLGVLHARYIGWVKNLGFAVLATVCFCFVLFAWFGVNFLNAGLHTYGSTGSEGHRWLLGTFLVIQVGYAALASIVGINRRAAAADAKAIADAEPS